VNNYILLGTAMLAGFVEPGHANSRQANPVSRRAFITGVGGNGRCTIEVNVDRAAEVEISGDMGLLTTLEGQPAAWRRYQCNAPLPTQPRDFRVDGGGRGNVRLVQDPRSTGGRAVIWINDPKGGRGNYTFELRWRERGLPPPPPNPAPWPGAGGFPMAKAIRVCRDAVTDRLSRNGYEYITIDRIIPDENPRGSDDNPGRHDWITGRASGDRGNGTRRFSFSCSVDFGSGSVRSVNVQRSW
jgi:hypothetical protein